LSRCIEGKETEAEVLANVADGRALGVDATPTLFLNVRKLVGAMQWDLLQQLLTMELDRQTQIAKK
jgi:protein-disulfide isomerase